MVRFRLRLQLHEYELAAGLTVIGRGPNCNLTIDDALLSRDHAAVRLTDDRVTIRDLGSRNGTWVNGQCIEDDVELHDGDRIKVGTTEILFSRTISTRRTVATTASVTTCGTCGSPYVVQAACCPRCGTAPRVQRPRTDSQRRRDFWLSLEAELLNKALELLRHDEAHDAATRIMSKLDELIADGRRFDRDAIETALIAIVRLARVRGFGRIIGWTFDAMRRLDIVPGPELFALIAETAPIVLEEASADLQALIREKSLRANGPAERSCLHSLKSLHDELVAYGAMRAADTAPRSAVNALA